METQIFFTLYDGAFWLSIIVVVVGILIIGGVIFFGLNIGPRVDMSDGLLGRLRYFEEVYLQMAHSGSPADRLAGERMFVELIKSHRDALADFRLRRNEFWTSYGQLVLSLVVIVMLVVLLITRTITAEAGLPILSGMSGFAIAKGVVAGRGDSGTGETPTPPLPPPPQQ
ncbi:MAG: hypothetical protein ABI831_15050 [Betaproteobacteria bacterium]